MRLIKPKDPNFRQRGRRRGPLKGGSEIGNLLATLRTQQGWTLVEASHQAGISHRTLAKLERGGLDTSLSNLEKYLNLFGFTLIAKRMGSDKKEDTNLDLDEKGLPLW